MDILRGRRDADSGVHARISPTAIAAHGSPGSRLHGRRPGRPSSLPVPIHPLATVRTWARCDVGQLGAEFLTRLNDQRDQSNRR